MCKYFFIYIKNSLADSDQLHNKCTAYYYTYKVNFKRPVYMSCLINMDFII